jgi:hypothetical protein
MTRVRKGAIVQVHSVDGRHSDFEGIALEGFDTKKDEWYPIAVHQDEPVEGLSRIWGRGQEKDGRRGLDAIRLKGEK